MKKLNVEMKTGNDTSGLLIVDVCVNGLTEMTMVQDHDLSFKVLDQDGIWPAVYADIDAAQKAVEEKLLNDYSGELSNG